MSWIERGSGRLIGVTLTVRPVCGWKKDTPEFRGGLYALYDKATQRDVVCQCPQVTDCSPRERVAARRSMAGVWVERRLRRPRLSRRHEQDGQSRQEHACQFALSALGSSPTMSAQLHPDFVAFGSARGHDAA